MKDIIKSVKVNLYERVTSPLFGAFFFSWCIWNYKTIFVLTSKLKVKEKFEFIENSIYVNLWDLISTSFLYPLFMSIVFLILYPYPAKWIYEYWYNKQKELKLIRQKIEDETPLTIEEARDIRRELYRLETEFDSEFSRKDEEIERLKNVIVDLEKRPTVTPKGNAAIKPSSIPNTKPLKRKKSELDGDLLNIIRVITEAGGLLTEDELLGKINFGKVKALHYLDTLESNGYVSREYNSSIRAKAVELTALGKKIAVEKSMAE